MYHSNLKTLTPLKNCEIANLQTTFHRQFCKYIHNRSMKLPIWSLSNQFKTSN